MDQPASVRREVHVLDWVFGNKRAKGQGRSAPSYEESRALAAHGDVEARARLAEHHDLQPEFLYYFATDPDVKVRTAVAANPGTPLQADVILAKDREVSVRTVLATKITQILPNLRPDQSEKLAELAFEVLETLAQDQEARVRRIVAESIKSLDNVPKPIVMLLARDLEEMVSMPVLEYSPLLDEQDLLQLILSGVNGKRLAAVSRREDLTAGVIDAIVETEDDVAVEALIGNERAAIPDKTFDTILKSAKHREGWQSALVSRARIPRATLLRLSKIATDSVLRRLTERSDLGEEFEAKLAEIVNDKVRETVSAEEPAKEDPDQRDAAELAMETAVLLNETNGLTEAVVLGAITDNDRDFLEACLAVLSGQTLATVRNLLKMQSAKSVLALTWKCGLTMKTAMVLQEKVTRLAPNKIIRPGADGGFPLSDEDLSWQAELLFD